MTTLRKTASRIDPVFPDTLGQSLYERFREEPDCLAVAVVDDQRRPVGLVERNAFVLKMAAEYGRALWAKRPISMIMDADPLVVEANAWVADFTAQALSDRASDLLRGFIVVEDGRYFGVGSALALLKHTSEATRKHADEMAALAAQLATANGDAHEARTFMSEIIENIPAMVFVKSAKDLSFVLMNKAGEEILGFPRDSLIGKSDRDFFPDDQVDCFAERDRAVLNSGEVCLIEEEQVRRADGSEVLLRTKKLAIKDQAGRPRYLLGVSEDITERRQHERLIARMAHYDPLTDLPNRVLFRQELEAALARTGRGAGPAQSVAVLCLDLDHFKTVNDTMGHPAGDALLKMVAHRLQGCLRSGDLVARLGGDEFAIVQATPEGANAAVRLAQRIVDALAAPFDLEGAVVVIGASVGIAMSPVDARQADELLKKADMALYRAKSEGRGAFHFFERGMDEALQRKRALEIDLRSALAGGQFELHYQPLYAFARDEIVGQEALLRWRHPTRGLVFPGEFIPLAEEIGLIAAIGEWVLRRACADAASWPNAHKLAVNISPVQFRSRDLVRSVVSALSVSGLSPSRLELEITESVLLSESSANSRMLHQLRQLGVRISMDDFGTGYSSLSYLRRFPFDKIKIDQSFVRDLPGNGEALAIIRAVVELGASLGMTVTAEGVETPEQLEELRKAGCHEAQGYLIGRPEPLPSALPLFAGEVATLHDAEAAAPQPKPDRAAA